jgi:hypothetical protein
VWRRFCERFLKRHLLTVSRSFMNVANSELWRMAINLKVNKVNLFVSSVLFVSGTIHQTFWTHHVYLHFIGLPHLYTFQAHLQLIIRR